MEYQNILPKALLRRRCAQYDGVHDPTATSEAFGSILVFYLHQEGGRSTVITLLPTL